MEDVYENPPPGGVPLDSGDNVRFKTGDPVVDKWEEQYARGEMPDLDAILTPEEQAQLAAQAAQHEKDEGFEDSYGAVDSIIEAEVAPSVTPPPVKK